jgi:hypothetical protein
MQIPPQFEAPLVLDADEDRPAGRGQASTSRRGRGETCSCLADEAAAAAGARTDRGAGSTGCGSRSPQPPAVIFKDQESAPASPSAPRRPVFTDQLPSIVVDRPREAVALPPVRRAPTRARSSRSVMPLVGALLALVVLGGGAFAAKRFLFREKAVLTGVTPSRAEQARRS